MFLFSGVFFQSKGKRGAGDDKRMRDESGLEIKEIEYITLKLNSPKP